MSVYVTTYIWEHCSQAGNARLLLLAIGDHADRDGSCYPSVKRLAAYTLLSERTVQRMIQRLVAAGELRVKPQGGPKGAHLFEVVMNRSLPLFKDAQEGGVTDCHPVTPLTGGVTNQTKRGDRAVSPEPSGTTKEPSVHVRLQEAKEIGRRAIAYLNEKAGTHYRPTEANLKFATARIQQEGASYGDLVAVVDLKVADRDFDRKYLRPETLWNATKFGSYLGQVGASLPPAAPEPTRVTVLGEDGMGASVSLYASQVPGEPDPERLARHALEHGYCRARFPGGNCKNIVVEWAGHRAVYATAELQRGRRA